MSPSRNQPCDAEKEPLSPVSEPSAESLVRDLRSPSHRQPINPKANYRTRDIQLFEDAAACIERLSEALGYISRMRTMPDDKTNTFTLAMAHRIANKALGLSTADTSDRQSIPGRHSSES